MALSYEFSIGSVRAKENTLFTNAEVEQMLACKSENELVRFLNEKGFGEGSSIDEIINNNTKDMWAYLRSIAPDFEIFNPFFYQNDVHNLKATLKGIMAQRDYESMLITPCTIDKEHLKSAVENRKFNILPQWILEAADKAYEIIAHTGDARLCDAVIDKAVMQKMLDEGKKSNSEFLKEYFNTVVFYSNIKIAIRASRTGTSREYLLQALCEVKDFRMSAVISAALKGHNALLDMLSKFSEYDCRKAIEEYKKSPSAFERFVDDKLMTLTRENCKRASSGAEPIMGYYLGCEAQKKVIHIIASGLRTQTHVDIIRERLREIYG